jgi:hypothetical protein
MTDKRLFAFLNRSIQKETEAMIDRHPELAGMLSNGYANGYVAVPPSHPFYLFDYDTVNETIEIHGGLTFAAPMEKIMEFWPKEDTECIGFDSMDEIPKDYWVFGFDTLHAFDGPHLDRQWCIDETKNLMKQLETQKGEVG